MLRAKVCVARCVTLRAMLRMLWHMMLRVRLRVADFDSSVRRAGVFRLRTSKKQKPRALVTRSHCCCSSRARRVSRTCRQSATETTELRKHSPASATSRASLPARSVSTHSRGNYADRRSHKDHARQGRPCSPVYNRQEVRLCSTAYRAHSTYLR